MSANQNTIGGISKKQSGLTPGMIRVLIAILAVALIASFAIKTIDNASVTKTVTATETTGEEAVETAGTGDMTNIVPRAAVEEDYLTRTEDINGIIVNNQGEISGTISVDQIPATILIDGSMSKSIIITNYIIDEEGDVRLNFINNGIGIADIRFGATFPSATRFDPRTPGLNIYNGHEKEVIISCPNNELPEKIVVRINERG